MHSVSTAAGLSQGPEGSCYPAVTVHLCTIGSVMVSLPAAKPWSGTKTRLCALVSPERPLDYPPVDVCEDEESGEHKGELWTMASERQHPLPGGLSRAFMENQSEHCTFSHEANTSTQALLNLSHLNQTYTNVGLSFHSLWEGPPRRPQVCSSVLYYWDVNWSDREQVYVWP